VEKLNFVDPRGLPTEPDLEVNITAHWMQQRFGVSPLFFSSLETEIQVVKTGSGASLLRWEEGKRVSLGGCFGSTEYNPYLPTRPYLYFFLSKMEYTGFPLAGSYLWLMSGSLIVLRRANHRRTLYMTARKNPKKSFYHTPGQQIPRHFCDLWQSTHSFPNNASMSGVKKYLLLEKISLNMYVKAQLIESLLKISYLFLKGKFFDFRFLCNRKRRGR